MRAGLWQIVLVVVLVFILFGHNKIPGMMKNLAGGIKTFKKEMNEPDGKPAAPKKKPAVKKAAVKKSVVKKSAPAPKKKRAAKKA